MQEIRKEAENRLPFPYFSFLEGGANTEATLQRNKSAFSLYKLKKRVLQGSLTPILMTELFGKRMRLPLGISPTGMNGVAWPQADQLLMRSAQMRGFALSISTGSFTPLERATVLAPSVPKIFQFYFTRFPEVNKMVIRKLETSGYDALAVTVDAPIYGKRVRQIHSGYKPPPHFRFVNLQRFYSAQTSQKQKHGLQLRPEQKTTGSRRG